MRLKVALEKRKKRGSHEGGKKHRKHGTADGEEGEQLVTMCHALIHIEIIWRGAV